MVVFTNLFDTPGLAGFLTGIAFLGSITALAITGHITGGEALTALGILGGGATAVTATHVTGNAIGKVAAPAGTDTSGSAAGAVQPAPPQSPAVPAPAQPQVMV